MRALAVVCVLFSFSVLADDLRVAVGMPKEKAVSIIKANGGEDSTPTLDIVGPKGEHPVYGFYWYLKDYKAMVAVSGKEKVEWLTYWTEKDFGKSKDHRTKSAKEISAFTIDPRAKRILIETNKP
jgi:hypothetical protein